MADFKKTGTRMASAWFRASGKDAPSGGGLLSATGQEWRRLMALLRMLKAWSSGRYKDVPKKTLLLSTAALVYFLSPIDLIPDFIPVVGVLDDVTVVMLVLSAIGQDLERFQAWEERQRNTIEAENPASAIS
jgi:uncharacterized membrane protein YkvA (DUF1232 family)